MRAHGAHREQQYEEIRQERAMVAAFAEPQAVTANIQQE